MLFAKVVLGLPVEGPFDYRIPAELEEKACLGARVRVNFRNKKETAYITSLSEKTDIKRVKEIAQLLDNAPVLDRKIFLLTRQLADYYCCSWGEAIEAALPLDMRKGKPVASAGICLKEGLLPDKRQSEENKPVFVRGFLRLPVYLAQVSEAVRLKRSVIVLCINAAAAQKLKTQIESALKQEVFISMRRHEGELQTWEKIRQKEFSIVVGTRSAVFAPVNNLGLLIIDEPQETVYKQEQSPHYHALFAAAARSRNEGAKLILGSHCFSVESYYLLQKGEILLENAPDKPVYPQIKVIDPGRVPYSQRKNKPLFSKFLLDSIQVTLDEKGKVLLVINRKGFATTVTCQNCGKALKCPRCNINLVFHFDDNKLKCHHCNFAMAAPRVCPECHAGYIKYSGLGTEKVESELARIFPLARIGSDIVVATGSVINNPELNFDLVGVVDIDAALNRVDFRAAEKTFFMLSGIAGLSAKKVIIQSANPNHHCFRALSNNRPEIFFEEELKYRRQLQLNPFKHMVLIKIRGPQEEKVKKVAQELFSGMNKIKTTAIKLLSLNAGMPAKLRGNFYYQILCRASSVERAGHFLKLHLKERHLSGIIITIDVDPI